MTYINQTNQPLDPAEVARLAAEEEKIRAQRIAAVRGQDAANKGDAVIPAQLLGQTPPKFSFKTSAALASNDDQPIVEQIPPIALKPNFDNIPTELTALPNWLMWKYIQKPGKKKPDKVPFQPNGSHASTTNSATWSKFDTCRATYNNGGNFDGIGFVFDGKKGDDGLCFTGVDFDHCIDNTGVLEPARSQINRLRLTPKCRSAAPASTVSDERNRAAPLNLQRWKSTAAGAISPSPAHALGILPSDRSLM
jgi:hypothetical protein